MNFESGDRSDDKFNNQLAAVYQLAHFDIFSLDKAETEIAKDIKRALTANFTPGMHQQVQTCLCVALMTSCVFCDDGLRRLYALIEFVFVKATTIAKYIEKRTSAVVDSEDAALGEESSSNSIDERAYKDTIVFQFLEFVWLLNRRRQATPGLTVGCTLLSVASHASILKRSSGDSLLQHCVSNHFMNVNKTRIAIIDRIICDGLLSSSVVAMVDITKTILDCAVNTNVDWCALFVDRAAQMNNMKALPEDLRLLPLYVSAIVRTCGGAKEFHPIAKAVVSTSLGAIVAKSYDCRTKDAVGCCAMKCDSITEAELVSNKRRACVERDHVRERVHNKRRLYSRRSLDKASERLLACCSGKKARKSAAAAGDDEGAPIHLMCKEIIAQFFRVIAYDNETYASEGRSDGAAPRGKKRARDASAAAQHAGSKKTKRRVDSAQVIRLEPITADAYNDAYNIPLFGGPIIHYDHKENPAARRAPRAPRQFMCTLLRTVDSRHAPAGGTVCVRGPLYRSFDNGRLQKGNPIANSRIISYLNGLRRRYDMANLQTMPVCEIVRAPLPSGSARCSSEPVARQVRALLEACTGSLDDDRIVASPRFEDQITESIFLAGEANTSGIVENTFTVDIDGSLPLWLVMSDPTGDYRQNPWKVVNADCFGSSQIGYIRSMMQRRARDRYLRPHYYTQLYLDRMRQNKNNVFYPDPERIARSALLGDSDASLQCERIYCYMIYRAAIGVVDLAHKRCIMMGSGGTATYQMQDMTLNQGRMPVFDASKRRKNLSMIPERYKYGDRLKFLRLFSQPKGAGRSRDERLAKCARHLREVTIPMAKVVHRINRMMKEQRHISIDAATTLMDQLNTLYTRLYSSGTDSGRSDISGVSRYCCIMTPSTAKATWYNLIGSLYYIASKVMGLDSDLWGYCPRGLFRINKLKEDMNTYTPHGLTLYAYSKWVSSLVRKKKPLYSTFVDKGQLKRSARSSRELNPRDAAGWIFNGDSMQRVLECLRQWKQSMRSEVARIEKLCETHDAQLRAVRAAYNRNDGWLAVSKRINDEIAADEAKRAEANLGCGSGSVPRTLLGGNGIVWDPDTMPDPVWLCKDFLPQMLQSVDALIKMYTGVMRDKRSAWWDMLEYTHGKNALERYVNAIDDEMRRYYRKSIMKEFRRFLDQLKTAQTARA